MGRNKGSLSGKTINRRRNSKILSLTEAKKMSPHHCSYIHGKVKRPLSKPKQTKLTNYHSCDTCSAVIFEKTQLILVSNSDLAQTILDCL